MLMDGRLVALPEEERRLMRAAAAAAKSAERDLQLDAQRGSAGTARARRMHRATIDSQTPSPTRGAPRVSAWPRPRKANSLDLPARDRMLIQQSESRCTAVMSACHLKHSRVDIQQPHRSQSLFRSS